MDVIIAVFEAGEDVTSPGVEPIDSVETSFSNNTASFSFPTAELGTYDIYAIVDMDSSTDFSGPESGDRVAESLSYVVDSNATINFLEVDFSFTDNDSGTDYLVGGYVEHDDDPIAVDGKDVIILTLILSCESYISNA